MVKASAAVETSSIAKKPASAKLPKPKPSKPKSSSPPKPASVSTQDRSFHEWTDKEDDAIMEACLPSDGEAVRLADLASKFRREPLLILERIRSSEVLDMLNFDCVVSSDEEIEFFGLALAGAPLGLALCWCSASDEGDEANRVTTQELEASFTGPDMREPLSLARDLGLWNAAGNAAQRAALLEIFNLINLGQGAHAQAMAVVASILERFDAPTPASVLAHLKGTQPAEPKARAYPWGTPNLSVEALFETLGNDWFAGSTHSKGSGRTGAYRRRKSSSAASSSASSSPSGTKTYASAGKRKSWGRKRKASGAKASRTSKAKKTGFDRYAYPW